LVLRGHVESFAARKEQYQLTDSVDLGLRIVPVSNIVGSVNRWQDFDAKFRVRNRTTYHRYQRIKRAVERGEILPPVQLYKVKDRYYVVDGNHRVAVAKEVGQAYIDAYVTEYLPPGDTKSHLLWRERSAFQRQTGLLDIEFTELGSYDKLIAQIRDYQAEQSAELGMEQPLDHAASSWYEEIYKPVVELIRKQRLLDDFPNRTEADLFLYATYHKLAKSRLTNQRVSYRDALADFQVEEHRSFAEQLKDLITGLFTPADEHDRCPYHSLIMDEDGLVHVTPDCPGCRRCVRSPEFTIQDEDSPLYD
jgi:hypothetical protein